jgi:eukaryotic-like serine/threonine-protein kinase
MASKTPNLPPPLPAPPSEGRLDSWKEIASYLRCSVRTVRRWEQEGLPVHRHPHKRKAAIYAYKPEIDFWWRDGRERLKLISKPSRGSRRALVLSAAIGSAVLIAATALVWMYRPPSGSERSDWVQLTSFQDAVTQPALSPDGRLLAFVRGPSTFVGQGEIYVKMLPSGQPVQLTHDGLRKMSPVFSPEGSRIAYTAQGERSTWDTWVVPVLGGKPQVWLPNASGLVWIDGQRLLFSTMIEGDHMGIVTCLDSRSRCRDVYVPANDGMAHRSYPSPDGKSVLAIEMDAKGTWMPCRLVPIDGSSAGQPVGPPGAPCTSAAWSPDGKQMYVDVNTGHNFHIWRQRFPEGKPEQLTSGPTGEEGIAMAADGRSLITAVGLRQRAIWFHDVSGDHPVSIEGYAFDPRLYFAGRKVCFRTSKSTSTRLGQVWLGDLDSGQNALLLPGFDVVDYDISADGRIVVSALDAQGKPRLWLGWLDRRSPPRQIPTVEGDQPLFSPDGDIFFLATEANGKFLLRVHPDGTDLQKVSPLPLVESHSVSPDGAWVAALGSTPGQPGWFEYAYPTKGGKPVPLCDPPCSVRWAPDGKSMYVSMYTGWATLRATGRTYVLPTRPGTVFPEIPAGGFRSETGLAAVPGVRIIQAADVDLGPGPDVYVFSRETTQRNLFRVPLH